jgi:hypothetical protein
LFAEDVGYAVNRIRSGQGIQIDRCFGADPKGMVEGF